MTTQELTAAEREATRDTLAMIWANRGFDDGSDLFDVIEPLFAAFKADAYVAGRRDALTEAAEAIRALRADAAMPSPLSYRSGRDDAVRVVDGLRSRGSDE